MEKTEELTPEEDARIVDSYRASGDLICDKCGRTYYRHPGWKPSAKTCGYVWLHELCNGDLVKL